MNNIIDLIIAEGTAEKTIIDILGSEGKLRCSYNGENTIMGLGWDKIEEKIDEFEEYGDYNGASFKKVKFNLYVILDSPQRLINPRGKYISKINQISYYITRPEIEVIHLEKFDEWKRNYETYKKTKKSAKEQKPSAFFKASKRAGGLAIKEIKKEYQIREIWEDDINGLVQAIKNVGRQQKKGLNSSKNQYCLSDLLN